MNAVEMENQELMIKVEFRQKGEELLINEKESMEMKIKELEQNNKELLKIQDDEDKKFE